MVFPLPSSSPCSKSWLALLLLVLASSLAQDDDYTTDGAAAPYEVKNAKGMCSIFVRPFGYPCREFAVPTADGFLLGVQRIAGKGRAPTKGPVFLYHGIMQGGDIWVINGPGESLGFVLADAGYDVFIGNTRSSNFSYGHRSLAESDDGFWNWNMDDLIAGDLPSMLRFVQGQTRQSMHYVGFSQGTMTAFAAFSDPNNARLVKKAAMLSPVAYLEHVQAPMLSIASWMFLDKILLLAGVAEFRVENAGGKRVINDVCKKIEDKDCYDHLLDLITGPNCCIDIRRKPILNRYEMQATSMRNMAQMAQMVRSGEFQRYDYGVLGNLRRYHSVWPPSYNLRNIPQSLPILLIRGQKDELAAQQDADRLVRELPGNPVMVVVPRYAHGDVILASSAPTETFRRVIGFFER